MRAACSRRGAPRREHAEAVSSALDLDLAGLGLLGDRHDEPQHAVAVGGLDLVEVEVVAEHELAAVGAADALGPGVVTRPGSGGSDSVGSGVGSAEIVGSGGARVGVGLAGTVGVGVGRS